MMRRILISAVALLVVAGVAAALSLISPMRRPAPAAVDLPRAAKLTCSLPGDVVVEGEGTPTVTQVAGGDSVDAAPGTAVAASTPVNVRADGDIAAGVVVAGTPRLFAPCASPTTTGVLLIDDPATAELLLTNADAAEASVDLRLIGPDGELSPVGSRGIAIAPGVTRPVALSILAPEGPVAVVYSTSHGRVAAVARNVEGRAARVVTPTDLREEHLIAGVPAGASSVKLLVTNPTENRVNVTTTAMGPGGSYEPASTTGLTLAPMTSQIVDVTADLSGEASTLRVVGDGELGASVITQVGTGAPTTLTDSASVTDLMGAAPSGATLQLTNPGTAAATVQTSEPGGEARTPVTIPAGATLAVESTARLRVTSETPLVGAMVVAGDEGAVVVPLAPAAGTPASPGTTVLDPELR